MQGQDFANTEINMAEQTCALSWLQVSAFGSDTETDGGDVWTVEWDSKYKSWKQDQKVGWM